MYNLKLMYTCVKNYFFFFNIHVLFRWQESVLKEVPNLFSFEVISHLYSIFFFSKI
jgi:hypothetical protein